MKTPGLILLSSRRCWYYHLVMPKTRAADAAGTRYRRYVNVRVIQGRQLIVYDTRAGVGGSELVRISRRIGKMPE